jgi:tetratricopeptide (TPR) repeat protein
MNPRAVLAAAAWCLAAASSYAAAPPDSASVHTLAAGAAGGASFTQGATRSPPPSTAADPKPDAENAPDDSIPLPIPPVAPRIAEGDQYDRCMDMLADDPAGADALAVAWKTGGEAATQCHALAQVELGNPAAGATLLTDLAATSKADPGARAEVFGQAAQAWTMAGNTAQAYATATQAITLSPDDPDLRVTHAIAALAVHQDRQAVDDLTAVLATDPKRADALTLRATAHRRLNELSDAEADIAAACAQDPENPDALLERGIIRQRAGDRDGARADWEKVSDLSPDSPTADLAQQDLALLDAGPVQ